MKYWRHAAATTWTLTIAWLSLTAGKNLPHLDWDFIAPDKAAHFAVYAMLCGLWLYALAKYRHYYAYIIAACTAYGALMEYAQWQLTNDRMFEYPDMLANMLGSVLGALIYWGITRQRNSPNL